MSIVPQPHKCIKCGHEERYSQDIQHSAPVVGRFVGCPVCWEQFLRANVGEMLCVVDFSQDRSGSEYEKAVKAILENSTNKAFQP